MNVLFWVSEVLLVLALPYGLLFTILSLEVPIYLIPGLFLILSVCLFRWLVERRQRRERPDLVWLPWYKRLRLALFPLLICVPFFMHLCFPRGYADNIFNLPACLWLFYTLLIVLRIIDNLFSHWDPKQAPSPGGRVEQMVWISETMLVTVLLIGSQKIIVSWGQSVFWPELAWNLAMILLACFYRWLIERRQRRERQDLIWLPWYKRIWLTLIPLLFCAYPLVAFGIHYNDTLEMFEEDTRFFEHMLYWGLAFPTILIPRILDNIFSHREVK